MFSVFSKKVHVLLFVSFVFNAFFLFFFLISPQRLVFLPYSSEFSQGKGRPCPEEIILLWEQWKEKSPQEQLDSLVGEEIFIDSFSSRALSLAFLDREGTFQWERLEEGLLLEVLQMDGKDLRSPKHLTLWQKKALLGILSQERLISPSALFLALQKGERVWQEAFISSEAFFQLSLFFERGGEKMEKKELLALLLETEWTVIESFLEKRKEYMEDSPEALDRFLLSFLPNSPRVARLMFDKRKERLEFWEQEDWKKLLMALPEGNKEWLEHYRFLFKDMSFLAPRGEDGEILHSVQAGESLWKIARKYGVSIEAIKSFNALTKDGLIKGQRLKIPSQS